jgi:hypothetical protein
VAPVAPATNTFSILMIYNKPVKCQPIEVSLTLVYAAINVIFFFLLFLFNGIQLQQSRELTPV